ncbi:MAG: hypothetical protein LBB95_00830 [Mycoplasmataceae bacterium]|nr:hypothetical protein [Mycoplasmataceae bacterium]
MKFNLFTLNDKIAITGFFTFVILYLVFSFTKKIYLWYRYRLSYNVFSRLTPKKITNISMIIATSISIIFLLTILSSGLMGLLFRVYPSWRSLIEGILIKLGGLVFGPIIGIFIGGITDIMTVLLTAGMFHYGYFIAALAYGFFAGIVRNIIVGKKNLFSMMILTTLFGILGTVLTNLYLYFTPSLASHNFSLSILKINVVFTYLQICLILDGTVGLILIIIWVYFVIRYQIYIHKLWIEFKYRKIYGVQKNILIYKIKKNIKTDVNAKKLFEIQNTHYSSIIKYANIMSKMQKKILYINSHNMLRILLPVICTIFFGEQIVNITIMPTFDYQLGGGIPFDSWVLIRIVSFPLLATINILVIWPCYNVISRFVDTTPTKEIYKGN